MKKLFCLCLIFALLLSGCTTMDYLLSNDEDVSEKAPNNLVGDSLDKDDNNTESTGSTKATTPNITTSQKNALATAKSYLKYSAFSYTGLIGQLEYEGYSYEDCVYAVDNCGADWYEQAVKCAESYLKYSSFSYSELVGQLEYEGFTSEQAKHGADKAYGSNSNSSSSGTSVSKQNALASAKSYLKYSAFSYNGLIDQLEYEGYPYEDCVYAVDNCGADWYEQAVKCAESYLKYSSFSYSELVDQLEYEGFTSEQAKHGADKAYGSNSNSSSSGTSVSKQNALASAKSYLKYSAFSYNGLIDQLEYEGYPYEDCVYAVDNCGADWYEQAVKCAASYLKYSSFSYSELVDQLEYEGFTYDQAVYGVTQNGL